MVWIKNQNSKMEKLLHIILDIVLLMQIIALITLTIYTLIIYVEYWIWVIKNYFNQNK